MKRITVTLTEDQTDYLWLLLAHDIRQLQDTRMTELNGKNLEKAKAFNRRITDKLAKAKS